MSTNTIFENQFFSSEEKRIIEWINNPNPEQTSKMRAPSKESVDFILSFSKALIVDETKAIGTIEYLQN